MNHEKFRARLADITGQLPDGARLLIVSKTRTPEEIQAYYQLGHRDFGENRVQELLSKAQALGGTCPELRWHMIGHLQSNKVNQLLQVPALHAIHSVHDSSLLEKLLGARDRVSERLGLFLQVNTSREQEKSGFEDYPSLREAALAFEGHDKFHLRGLMTMGTLRTEDFEGEARRCFQELKALERRLSEELGQSLESSMGMSQDYKIALEEGSNWVRIGTMMFH